MTDYEEYTTSSGIPVSLRFQQNAKGRWVITGLCLERPVEDAIGSKVLRLISLASIEAEVNHKRWKEQPLA